MSLNDGLALAIAMIILALVPGPAVFAVIAKAMSNGFKQGLAMSAGIVAGDFVFILFTVFGLAVIAEQLGELFGLIKYLGAIYLIWLGIKCWREPPQEVVIESSLNTSLKQSFVTGLAITLGNPKAIFFYISLFPAFIELRQITTVEIITLLALATVTIGGVNVAYAYLGYQAKRWFNSYQARKRLNRTAAGVMMGTGSWLIVES